MATAALSSCQQLKPGGSLAGMTPSPWAAKTSPVARSISTESSGGPLEKVRLRVGFGGSFILDSNQQFKYVGGSWHLDSIPVTFKYADLAFRLTEKVNEAISIKYLHPGDALDEDNLIGVWDDADVEEMFEEYAALHSEAQGRAPRLQVFLFTASEEDGPVLTPEEDLEGCDFFGQHGSGGQTGYRVALNSSLESSYSGEANDSPKECNWNDTMNANVHANGEEMALGLDGIENNPFVAPWHTPGSEETYSGASTVVQKTASAPRSSSRPHVMFESQGGFNWAAGQQEQSLAMHLPTHLSVFGDYGPKLPSHISVFGDSCSMQLQPAPLAMPPVPDAACSQPMANRGNGGSPEHPERGWEGAAGPGRVQEEAAQQVVRSPSWSSVLSAVPHLPKDGVRITGTIAEGAFGQVSIAKTHQFSEVAIKWIKPGRVNQHLGAFWREAKLLSRLNHPNVLRMYGVVVESDADPTIVGIMTEYVRGGSLSDNLRSRTTFLPLLLRAELALQVACGMAFLHESNVVHFDLKPDNLLLDVPLSSQAFNGGQAPCIKVADFGLSKEKRQSYVSGVGDLRGTLPFIAPELINDPGRITEKADVWSMGMLMWELLTLTSPFQDLEPNVIIGGLMKGTLRPEVPEWCEPSWEHLMRSCWALDPTARPSFRCMALELEHLIELLTLPGGP